MTDHDLLAGIGHLGYEVTQMTWAAGRLRTQSSPAASVAEGAAQNAALESGLIHARSLIEFMLDEPRHDDDMRPDDFYPGWVGPPAEVRTQLDAERKLLHKHLVHLTWQRVKDEPAAWDHEHTVRVIVDQLGAYADHVSTGAERGEIDGAVVRSLRAHLLWARQEIARWDRPVLTPRSASSVVSTTTDVFVLTTGGAFTPTSRAGLPLRTRRADSERRSAPAGRGAFCSGCATADYRYSSIRGREEAGIPYDLRRASYD
jgi:hypothetical protein